MSRVAVVQMRCSTEKDENLKIAIRYIGEAKRKGARLVAFPEFLMAYSPKNQPASALSKMAETINGEFVSTLRRAARKNRIGVAATIYEKSRKKDRVYDTAILIDRNGMVSSVYRKLHLYDALGFRESAKLVPGSELPLPVRTNAGRIGIMICYDVRFPELSRILALMGADTLILPSAWVEGKMKLEHWRTMLKARAIENGCYVVAPNQVGNIYIGHSMVADPFGRTLLEMREEEGIGVADLDFDLLREVRSKLPLLKNRRAEIYSKYFRPSGRG